MQSQPPVCSKCSGPLTPLAGGLMACPECGFEGEAAKAAPSTPSKRLFWIALLAPAAITLTMLAFGKSSREASDAVTSIFVVIFFLGAAAAIYCGISLARRFCKPGFLRVLAALGLIFVIGLVNLVVTFAGCATVAPMDFR